MSPEPTPVDAAEAVHDAPPATPPAAPTPPPEVVPAPITEPQPAPETVAEYYALKGLAGVQVRSLEAQVAGDLATPLTAGRKPLTHAVGVAGCWSTVAEALAWRTVAGAPEEAR